MCTAWWVIVNQRECYMSETWQFTIYLSKHFATPEHCFHDHRGSVSIFSGRWTDYLSVFLSDLSAVLLGKKLSSMGSSHLDLLPTLVNHSPPHLWLLIMSGLTCACIWQIFLSSCSAIYISLVVGGIHVFPSLCACVLLSTGHMTSIQLEMDMRDLLCSTWWWTSYLCCWACVLGLIRLYLVSPGDWSS